MRVHEEIEANVKAILGMNYKVKLTEAQKNNGVVLKGLAIRRKSEDLDMVIYLESFIANLEEDYEECDIQRIAHKVVAVYHEVKNDEKEKRWIESLKGSSKKEILDKTIYKIVNAEKNREMLEKIPHKEVWDLAVIYVCIIEKDEDGISTVTFNEDFMKVFEITADELEEAASKNTKEVQEFEVRDMQQVINELFGMEYDEDSMEETIMYVGKGRTCGSFGATIMMYPECFAELAETTEQDLMILPSSIHDVVIVPENATTIENAKCIVQEVNHTAVEEEEMLSDSVYMYRRETGKVELV